MSQNITIEENEKILLIKNLLKLNNKNIMAYNHILNEDSVKLLNLLKLDNLNNYEDDIDKQEEYYHILSKIIESIAYLKYEENKQNFDFVSIASINDYLFKNFAETFHTENDALIHELYVDICRFCGSECNHMFIYEQVETLYKIFEVKYGITLDETEEFCNYVLNIHRNNFLKKTINNSWIDLQGKIELNKKTHEKLVVDNKVSLFKKILKDNRDKTLIYCFYKDLINFKNDVLNNKYNKKIKIIPDENYIDKIIDKVMSGKFSKKDWIDKNSNVDLDTQKFLETLISKIITNYANKISNKEEKNVNHSDIKIHHNKHLIYNHEKFLDNYSKLVVKLSLSDIEHLMCNNNCYKLILKILPFSDLIDKIDIELIINIIRNYDRIINVISINDDYDNLFNHFDQVISLSKSYSSIDKLNYHVLGEFVINHVGEDKASKYIEVYKKMILRKKICVPPINMQYKNYSLISGDNYNEERLLIGKLPSRSSCIDLFETAGVKTYEEVLTKVTGDVVLVRDEFNNIITRIFLIRRGNYIQMKDNYGKMFSIDMYKKIADYIIQESTLNNDNIDYVFSANIEKNITKKYPMVEDVCFFSQFPHADFDDKVLLLSSKKDNIDLNSFAAMDASYDYNRLPIKYDATIEDLLKLTALKSILNNIEFDATRFILENNRDDLNFVCGEDWYIVLENNICISKFYLIDEDIKANEEIEFVLNNYIKKTL